jgi:hypothetical protein
MSPALQFSIIPVTATLGGLVISGANYSQLTTIQRNELLRVAQKFIVSTVSFIFFIALFSFALVGKRLNLNIFPSNSIDITRWILSWFAVGMFVTGVILFVLGIIDLALALKNIKIKEFDD